ncbi:MAG TPA: UDP-N-acetylmuramoyl-L-alanine--D-glutamate ligase [Spirochaetota bacterium]|nr:UDP-N-acetylmuramoyl-L-alanine--D-glutamate ligase [Spirochaetota bacterium]
MSESIIAKERKFWQDLQKKTFLIIGFTDRTGLAAARLFDRFQVRYRISELRPLSSFENLLQGLSVNYNDIYHGPQGPEQLQDVDAVLLSPGVPRSIALVKAAVSRGIPVYNDYDLLFTLYKEKKIIAVTGTDGKTTTASLLGDILSTTYKTVICGNNGIPVMSVYDRLLHSAVIILEMSSYMLEEIKFFHADYNIITNIDRDHLDRYDSFAAYKKAKFNLLRYCSAADVFIRNLDCSYIYNSSCPGRIIDVSRKKEAAYTYDMKTDQIRCQKGSFSFGQALLKGLHNIENIMFCAAVAEDMGVPFTEIKNSVLNFSPLPDRLEKVTAAAGKEVYNDSKATTVQAVARALSSFTKPIILIAGGRCKEFNFAPLVRYADKLKALVTYGEHGRRIMDFFSDLEKKYYYSSFTAAVKYAWSLIEEDDILLLSPAATSWDQFSSYHARGESFKKIIQQLAIHDE